MGTRRSKGKNKRASKKPGKNSGRKATKSQSKIILPPTPHERRMGQVGATLPPAPWEPGASEILEMLKSEAERNVSTRLLAKQSWHRACLMMRMKQLDGSGLQMAKSIRSFFSEYADRTVHHGPHTMPTSFNVLEAFLEYDPRSLLFAIRREREHLLCLQDYFDWYEKEELPREPSILMDVIEESTIYSYDFVSDPTEYRILQPEVTFVLAGAAFIRHDYELSCILIAGESPPLVDDHEAKTDIGSEDQVPPGKEGIRPHANWEVKHRYLDTRPDFARLILLTRFDLVSHRFDVRQISLDLGPSYRVITDDASVFDCFPPDERPDLNQVMDSIARYDSLYSAFTSLIYLPAAFVALAERVREQEFLTDLAAKKEEEDVKETIAELGAEEVALTRRVHCLQTYDQSVRNDKQPVEPPPMEYNTDGFWKALAPGQIGEGPDGQRVVGRTWVTRHESWTAYQPSAFLLTRVPVRLNGPDPGKVYIMRSPSHEPDVYKIGLTRRDADTRACELGSATGVPLPFAVIASWDVGDCAEAERECHTRLAAYRINPRREFFRGRLQDIILVIQQVIAELDDVD